MKKSDLVTAGFIAIIGLIIAYFLVDSLLGNPDEEVITFNYVASEIGGLVQPDAEMFNDSAINPTVEVYVGNCVDIDQDQSLNLAEKVSCNQLSAEDAEEQAKQQMMTEENNGQEGISDEESNNIDEILRGIQERNADRTNE